MFTGWPKYLLGGIGLFALLLALGFSTSPQGRDGAKTVFIIAEILPGVPVRPLSWFEPEPLVQEVQVATLSGPLPADLYRPKDERPHGAVILALGVTANFKDENLLRLSRALARSGAVVMVPKSQSLAEGFLFPDEVNNLVASFEFLQRQPYVDSQRVGFGGFSVGASLATLAAAVPRIRDSVAFLNFFGGYFDLADYIGAITSETMLYKGKKEQWQRKDTPWRVLPKSLIAFAQDPQDRAILAQAFPEGAPSPAEAPPGLTPEGAALYQLLANRESERTPDLVQALSAQHQGVLRRLSPRWILDEVKAPIFVMTDRNDDLVPYVESRRVADHLGERAARYTEFQLFQHVRPTRTVDIFHYVNDLAKLFRHLSLVLPRFM